MNRLVAVVVIALLSRVGAAQCLTANIEPYDCLGANPVTLKTSFPGEYPVAGLDFVVEAVGASPGSAGVLLVSSKSTCLPLPPPHSGSYLVGPSPLICIPYVIVPKWTFTIPNWPGALGAEFYLQSFSSKGAGFEASNGLHGTIGFYQSEIAVTGVVAPSGLIGEQGFANVLVTLKNSGNAPAMVPVTVTIGPNFGTATLGPVPPFGSFTGTVSVLVPASFGGCGASNSFTVTACSNLVDCDGSNNCKSTQTSIAVPYWDLDFSIASAPATAKRCFNTSWKVKIKNTGNVSSNNVCFISGITLSPGAGNWNNNLGLFFGSSGIIQPGSTVTIDVDPYTVWCNALLGTQWIKVEVHYSAGCFDNCNPGNNNFDQKSISIVP